MSSVEVSMATRGAERKAPNAKATPNAAISAAPQTMKKCRHLCSIGGGGAAAGRVVLSAVLRVGLGSETGGVGSDELPLMEASASRPTLTFAEAANDDVTRAPWRTIVRGRGRLASQHNAPDARHGRHKIAKCRRGAAPSLPAGATIVEDCATMGRTTGRPRQRDCGRSAPLPQVITTAEGPPHADRERAGREGQLADLSHHGGVR